MKRIACAEALILVLLTAPAQAGFVADFYDEARSNANVTSSGVLQSGALNTVTGGGFVWRQPRREFVPFSVTPPSLKAGCGGIDLFLGAFSIPSRDEFLSFLRSVGTALPGLAFQLALQTMAPDLNEQVSRYADLIRSYTNRYTDSCTAAQALLDAAGATEHIQRAAESAKNYLRSSGEVSDQSAADKLVRDNGEKAISKAPVRKDSSGNIIDAPEINLTWALLKSGNFAGSDAKKRELREIMMTLVGTTIFTKTGEGEDAVLQAREIAGSDLLPVIFGEARVTGAAERLTCQEAERCLTVESTSFDDLSLVDEMKRAASAYRQAIRRRDPSLVTEDDLYLLTGLSSVPMLKVLNLASVSLYEGIADDLVGVYAEAAAYEAVARAVEGLAGDMRTVLNSSAAGGVSLEHVRHVRVLETRMSEIERRLYERTDKLSQSMARAAGVMAQLEHIEKSLRASGAIELQRAMPSPLAAR